MAHSRDTVFSEYFLDEVGIKLPGADKADIITCVGSLEEEMNTKTITKSCRGRIKKSRTKGSDGTVTLTAHVPYDDLIGVWGMEEFADGVYGYGTTSMHGECVLTAKVLDEDDNVQYRAYPVAVNSTKSTSIDDDADEVAMVEMEFAVTADDNEMIVYQALEQDISEDIAKEWMENFSLDLIAKNEVLPDSVKTTAAKATKADK
ncbi:MAG: hypothetical protein LUD72_04600 [Bacteroidales bacterium]|nr:hypothetical protein [Bacteroidales bacterium]